MSRYRVCQPSNPNLKEIPFVDEIDICWCKSKAKFAWVPGVTAVTCFVPQCSQTHYRLCGTNWSVLRKMDVNKGCDRAVDGTYWRYTAACVYCHLTANITARISNYSNSELSQIGIKFPNCRRLVSTSCISRQDYKGGHMAAEVSVRITSS